MFKSKDPSNPYFCSKIQNKKQVKTKLIRPAGWSPKGHKSWPHRSHAFDFGYHPAF